MGAIDLLLSASHRLSQVNEFVCETDIPHDVNECEIYADMRRRRRRRRR